MKRRHKLTLLLSAAALLAVFFAVAALAAGNLSRPKPDGVVLSAGQNRVYPQAVENEEQNAAAPEESADMRSEAAEINPDVREQSTMSIVGEEVVETPEENVFEANMEVEETPEENAGGAHMEVVETSAESAFEANMEVEEPPMVYMTPGGQYYHGDSACSGMQDANSVSLLEAESAGKQCCPVCRPVKPDHAELFTETFGQPLSALKPGYSYRYTAEENGFLFLNTNYWVFSNGSDAEKLCATAEGTYEALAGALMTKGSVPDTAKFSGSGCMLTICDLDINTLSSFMQNAPDAIQAIYTKSLRGAGDRPAEKAGMLLLFDAENKLQLCEITFLGGNSDSAPETHCLWAIGEMGEMSSISLT